MPECGVVSCSNCHPWSSPQVSLGCLPRHLAAHEASLPKRPSRMFLKSKYIELPQQQRSISHQWVRCYVPHWARWQAYGFLLLSLEKTWTKLFEHLFSFPSNETLVLIYQLLIHTLLFLFFELASLFPMFRTQELFTFWCILHMLHLRLSWVVPL